MAYESVTTRMNPESGIAAFIAGDPTGGGSLHRSDLFGLANAVCEAASNPFSHMTGLILFMVVHISKQNPNTGGWGKYRLA
jgi:hypothetical protein